MNQATKFILQSLVLLGLAYCSFYLAMFRWPNWEVLHGVNPTATARMWCWLLFGIFSSAFLGLLLKEARAFGWGKAVGYVIAGVTLGAGAAFAFGATADDVWVTFFR